MAQGGSFGLAFGTSLVAGLIAGVIVLALGLAHASVDAGPLIVAYLVVGIASGAWLRRRRGRGVLLGGAVGWTAAIVLLMAADAVVIGGEVLWGLVIVLGVILWIAGFFGFAAAYLVAA